MKFSPSLEWEVKMLKHEVLNQKRKVRLYLVFIFGK